MLQGFHEPVKLSIGMIPQVFNVKGKKKKKTRRDSFLFYFIFFAAPRSLWDLSSPSRDQTPAHGSESVLTTGPPGNPPEGILDICVCVCYSYIHTHKYKRTHTHTQVQTYLTRFLSKRKLTL